MERSASIQEVSKSIARIIARPILAAANAAAREACPACGQRAVVLPIPGAITANLASQWGLSTVWRRYFDRREGHICGVCSCNLRSRQLAQAIVEHAKAQFGTHAESLAALVKEDKFRSVRIAEINACGGLHQFLTAHPGNSYSEFGSADVTVRNESLLGLTYGDQEFDMVLTSDTLEHVPDVDVALTEIWRILKPGAVHLFTVPIVADQRETRRRAEVTASGELIEHLPSSYHGSEAAAASDYLVFYEFGADFPDRVAALGFEVESIRDPQNPSLVVLKATKPRNEARSPQP